MTEEYAFILNVVEDSVVALEAIAAVGGFEMDDEDDGKVDDRVIGWMMFEWDDEEGDGWAVARLRRSMVSSEDSDIDVFVSSPDSIHSRD